MCLSKITSSIPEYTGYKFFFKDEDGLYYPYYNFCRHKDSAIQLYQWKYDSKNIYLTADEHIRTEYNKAQRYLTGFHIFKSKPSKRLINDFNNPGARLLKIRYRFISAEGFQTFYSRGTPHRYKIVVAREMKILEEVET